MIGTGSPPPFGVVAVVASLGGLAAVSTVLAALPATFPAHVVVAQHGRSDDDPGRLARLLSGVTDLPVRTARTGTSLYAPGVSVVPAGRHATVDATDRLALTAGPGTSGGDGLFAGVAAAAGPRVIGVVLTGMLADGAAGVRAVKRRGGRVLVEDPATARAGGMPGAAIATGCVDFVLRGDRIGPALVALTMAPGAAELLAVPTPSWARLHA